MSGATSILPVVGAVGVYLYALPVGGAVGVYLCDIQWNLSIAVTIGAKFSGYFRQVAALMR